MKQRQQLARKENRTMLCRLGVFFTLASTLAFGAVSAVSVSMAAVITATPGGVPEGAAFYESFDDLAPAGGTTVHGISVSFSGTGAGTINLPDTPGYYVAPIIAEGSALPFGNTQNEGSNETQYLTTGIGQVMMDLEGDHQYFGLLWGSADDHNLLSFYRGDTLLFSFTGMDVKNVANYGGEAAGDFYVNITSEDSFNRVIASSTRYGFEFDNVALGYGAISLPQEIEEVSEPGTLALVTLGLLIGLGLRRHFRQTIYARTWIAGV